MVPYVVAGLLVAAVGYWGLRSGVAGGPEHGGTLVTTVPVAAAGQGSGSAAGGGPAPGGASESAPTTTTTARLFVQVAGAVVRPGVYEVEPGGRVFQVLLQAGGMTSEADEDAVPLAAVVVDGGRIWVPRVGDPTGTGGAAAPGVVDVLGGSAVGSAGGAGGAPGGKVVLSTAGEAELDTLPGVGPKTAQQIIAYREQHGPFRSVEELEDVPGIGPATVERLRDLVVP
ncbi:MAG: helix-hairpin-helix domain-containing protein [Thermoleophilia bacterium]